MIIIMTLSYIVHAVVQRIYMIFHLKRMMMMFNHALVFLIAFILIFTFHIIQDSRDVQAEPLYDSIHISKSEPSLVLSQDEVCSFHVCTDFIISLFYKTLKEVDLNETGRHLKLLERSSQLQDSFDDDDDFDKTPIRFNFKDIQRKKPSKSTKKKPKEKKAKEKQKVIKA